MTWWRIVLERFNEGDELWTPGRGQEGSGKGAFTVLVKDPSKIVIRSGRSKIRLEKGLFEAVEGAFSKNPFLWLRVASLHGNEPFENSVDKLIREATGSQLARGNYLCSMLQCCGLVQYGMRGNKKGIEATQG